MKSVTIKICDESTSSDTVEIISEDLDINYTSTLIYDRLLNNYEYDDATYIEQMAICSQITRLIKRLNKISSKQNP